MATTPDDGGYWIVTNNGYVAACGDASYLGQQTTLNAPIVGIAATTDGGGYFLVASDGGIFTFGDARFLGSTGSMKLNKPVVGMAVDPATGGYWLVASDGGIFAYDAPFLGSTGSITLNKPVVGMAAGTDGNGYWMVAADGGIFAYGVPFWGSTGSIHLNRPVVGMAADAQSNGYWLVAADGGVFAYNAPFFGSIGNIVLNKPVVGMEANKSATGYRLVAADGGVFTYGTSPLNGTPASASSPTSTPPPEVSGGGSGGICTNPYITLNSTTVTTSTDANGTWWVDQDEWSSRAPQSMAVCSPSSWTVTTDQPAQSGNGVDTYPSTEYDVGGRDTYPSGDPKTIGAYNSITSTFSEAFPTKGDSFDAAYDMWTDDWKNETMIWNQYGGTQTYWSNCALNPATSVSVCGNQSYAVTLGGVAYDAMKLGTEVIFFRDTQVASGSVDILAAYDFEVSMGWAKSTDYVTQLQYGIEICSTTGSQVFPLTGLTFNLS